MVTLLLPLLHLLKMLTQQLLLIFRAHAHCRCHGTGVEVHLWLLVYLLGDGKLLAPFHCVAYELLTQLEEIRLIQFGFGISSTAGGAWQTSRWVLHLVDALNAVLIHTALELSERAWTGHRECSGGVVDYDCRGTLLMNEHPISLSLLVLADSVGVT